jgi:hypothetical protein
MRSILDFDAARAFLSQAENGADGEFEKWLRDNVPTIYVLKDKEHSERFRVSFSARIGLDRSVHRLTGGCGNMKPEAWFVLQNAIEAARGLSLDGTPQPKAVGLCLHGGTRMLFKKQPKLSRPGVTEVFSAIADHCPNASVVGIVARASKMFYSEYGLIIGCDEDTDYFTIVHPDQKAIAIMEKNSDEPHDKPWLIERLRCADIAGELQDMGWPILLSSIGGGGVTKDEIEHWAALSQEAGDPSKWRTLLVKGAGGSTDALAENKAWLTEHRNVHVCGCSVEEIRQAWLELGAVKLPK